MAKLKATRKRWVYELSPEFLVSCVKLARYGFILEIYKFTAHVGLALFDAKEPHQLI